MARMKKQLIAKGTSFSRSLVFIGEDDPYWKDKMEVYNKSMNYWLWSIITKRDTKMNV